MRTCLNFQVAKECRESKHLLYLIYCDFCRIKKKMTIVIMANSSHLEAIDPVIVGRVRAEQVEKGDSKRTYRRCVIS